MSITGVRITGSARRILALDNAAMPTGHRAPPVAQHLTEQQPGIDENLLVLGRQGVSQRRKRAEEEKEAEDVENGVKVIDVSEHHPRRIPSKKWRGLIKKVWEADPLICPVCQREMRIVSIIEERDVIETMFKCPGLRQQGVRVEPNHHSGTDPPNGPNTASP